MCPRLGTQDGSLRDLSPSPTPKHETQGRAVLWEFHPWVAWAQAEGRHRHCWEKRQGENNPAHQKHIRVQVSSRPRRQRLLGPHGPHHHQHSQSPHFNWMPPAVPLQPPRGGQAAAGCAGTGEETFREGARRKLGMPQGQHGLTYAPLGPVRRVRCSNVLRRGRAAGQHALLGLHQSRDNIHPSEYGAAKQRVPLRLHPQY